MAVGLQLALRLEWVVEPRLAPTLRLVLGLRSPLGFRVSACPAEPRSPL